MTDKRPSFLLYGYGNPGRQDDGLGIFFIREIERLGIPNCFFEENYQLNAEDALTVSKFDITVFCDASLKANRFSLTRLIPNSEINFTTHAMHPASVVALCKELYDSMPQCWLLEIRGYEWEMKDGLSEKAFENMQSAIEFMTPFLTNGKLEEITD